LETLVALLVLAIAFTVVLETQLTSLRMQQSARGLRLIRMETERVCLAVHLRQTPSQILAATGHEVNLTALTLSESMPPGLLAWNIAVRERPSGGQMLITRAAD
ncbi:MAG: hypothetical protein GX806_03865, partial [Lentisphaerae bacterium]|nr:hypothetical protein [Lentisphaerota bacterium]